MARRTGRLDMRRWSWVLLIVLFLFGGGYVARDSLVQLVDAYLYEPVLAACVMVTDIMEPGYLTIERRAFCNVSMIALASQTASAQTQSAETQRSETESAE